MQILRHKIRKEVLLLKWSLFTNLKDNTKYPKVVDVSKVGTYPTWVFAGAGYFYDDVLEYRVWIDPAVGGDYYVPFSNIEDAVKFSKRIPNAEPPLALVLQKESIDEPEPGQFALVTEPRITEWQVDWLEGRKRTKAKVREFFKAHKNR